MRKELVAVAMLVGMLLGVGLVGGRALAQTYAWQTPGWYRPQPVEGWQDLLMGDGGFRGREDRLLSRGTQVGPSRATTGGQWVQVRYSVEVWSGDSWAPLDSVDRYAAIPSGSGRVNVQGFEYSVPDSYAGSDSYRVRQTIWWYAGNSNIGGVEFVRNAAGWYVCRTVVQSDCMAFPGSIWLR